MHIYVMNFNENKMFDILCRDTLILSNQSVELTYEEFSLQTIHYKLESFFFP
jgi:hypothetical protein